MIFPVSYTPQQPTGYHAVLVGHPNPLPPANRNKKRRNKKEKSILFVQVGPLPLHLLRRGPNPLFRLHLAPAIRHRGLRRSVVRCWGRYCVPHLAWCPPTDPVAIAATAREGRMQRDNKYETTHTQRRPTTFLTSTHNAFLNLVY